MAIQQTKKQSDLEKRLRLLRQQVYGKRETQQKDKPSGQIYSSSIVTKVTMPEDRPIKTEGYSVTSDMTYLRHDLLRILTFSSFAIGAQALLFVLSNNHILNLVFL